MSIIGYTDTSGMASYNKRLSRRRAEVVSSKLIELGLSKDRVVGIIGRGENNQLKIMIQVKEEEKIAELNLGL